MDTKQWYKSKTIWASLVTVVIGVLATMGVGNLESEQNSIVDLIMQLVTIISGFVALYGRIAAKTKIETETPTSSNLLGMVLIAAILLGLIGCTGDTARQKTLLPAIDSAWQSLHPDAVIGGAIPNDLAVMDAAITSGNAIDLTAGWILCRSAVVAGLTVQLNDGSISSSLFTAKTETVARLDNAVQTYSGP